MLVLTRKWNESIFIGNDIEIFILEVRGGYVRLGIKAPQKIPVHRAEVYERMLSERQKHHSSEQLIKGATS